MSNIVWSDSVTPPAEQAAVNFTPECYEGKLSVPLTKALEIEERKVPLPDRRVHRSMSRAAILLSMVCLRAEEILKPYLEADPFRVGVYCAVENGPVDFDSTKKMGEITMENFAEKYRTYRNPKMYLKQLPNLAAAQMGIFMGILGPMNVYNHSKYGSLTALQQAEMDLADDLVDVALVCSSFSFENPLVVERVRRQGPDGRTVCEGAGAMVLTKSDDFTDWENQDYFSMTENFGISQQIIEIAKRRETSHD